MIRAAIKSYSKPVIDILYLREVLNRRVIVCVTNDLSHDQRVHKVCTTLQSLGYIVTLVGRELKSSTDLKRSYETRRFKLPFSSGALFYAVYNIRLFFYLLSQKAEVFHANDLDTLPAVYLASVFKRARIVYDSHEYFTEVPELTSRPLIRRIWSMIERFIFPKLRYVLTVNDSIASAYKKKYGVEVRVLRNVPFMKDTLELEKRKITRAGLGLPSDKKIIILQGAWINVDRGGEEAVRMMKYLPDCLLLIIGGGDMFEELKSIATKENVNERIRFFNRMPFAELRQYTMNADLGLSLDKGTNLNYLYSLPNKLFDYIHSGIPCFVSDMPEVAAVVRKHEVGVVTSSHDPKELARQINELLNDSQLIERLRKNCLAAREQFSWETESEVLGRFY